MHCGCVKFEVSSIDTEFSTQIGMLRRSRCIQMRVEGKDRRKTKFCGSWHSLCNYLLQFHIILIILPV